MEKTFREFIRDNELILHCGSTGTELMKMGGAAPGGINNMTCPEKVLELHKGYVDAGAKIAITNTFSMNSIYAATHAAGYDWREINIKGAEITKEASAGRSYVLGNMGPIGELLEPFGALKAEDAFAAFRSQAKLLADCGVDGFSVQTFYDLEEMKIAIKAIRDISDLPIMANLVFNANGATMMGNTPEQCYQELLPLGIDILGHNCGEIDFITLGDLLEPLAKKAEIPISACPNAGLPKNVDGKPYYAMTPQEFREGTQYLIKKGVRVLGGCCGVNLDHINEIVDLF